MTTGIEVLGIKKAIAFLKTKEKNITTEEKIALNKSASFMQGEVKQSIAGRRSEPTSVDTGRFLNSVQFFVGNDNAVIFSDLEYAKFLEFGTVRLKARRHFNNSKDRNKNKIVSIIAQQLKNI